MSQVDKVNYIFHIVGFFLSIIVLYVHFIKSFIPSIWQALAFRGFYYKFLIYFISSLFNSYKFFVSAEKSKKFITFSKKLV